MRKSNLLKIVGQLLGLAGLAQPTEDQKGRPEMFNIYRKVIAKKIEIARPKELRAIIEDHRAGLPVVDPSGVCQTIRDFAGRKLIASSPDIEDTMLVVEMCSAEVEQLARKYGSRFGEPFEKMVGVKLTV